MIVSMSLVGDIRDGATDHTVPLPDLLRKCKILGKRLKYDPLIEWVDNELGGYPSEESLPPYRRGGRAQVSGNLSGFGYSRMSRSPIPSACVEKEDRDILFSLKYLDSIAQYEAAVKYVQTIAAQDPDKHLSSPWPADFIAKYQSKIYEGWALTSAWREIPPGTFESILDQVRSRILTFMLEVEDRFPEVMEAEQPSSIPPVDSRDIGPVFQAIVYGDKNIITAGGGNVVNVTELAAGDWKGLDTVLSDMGLDSDDIQGLREAIQADQEAAEAPVPGRAVKAWLGDIATRVASGSVSLSGSAAGSTIATLVMKYLGVL